jgi:uncharacterized membrane protein
VASLLLCIALGVWYPDPYADVWKIVLAHVTAGRAGGVGLGLVKHFNLWFLFFITCIQDIVIMLIVYPWFVSGYQHVAAWPLIGPALSRTRALAYKYKAHIQPYGAIGLTLFVIFPFWSTGPLVGALVGYLIGLRTGIALTAITIGEIIAVGVWILFYDQLHRFSPKLAAVFLAIIFAVAIGGTFYARFRRGKTRSLGEPDSSEKEIPGSSGSRSTPGEE